MFCSTIIPTVGRTSVSRAVKSVLDQTLSAGEFEVIVVNDSGDELPDSGWLHDERVRLINTNRRERSVARNTGAAVARGRFLHFLDDDDWLFPDALERLWALSRQVDASWYYGNTQLVDRTGKPIIRLHHDLSGNCFLQVMAGEWIPLQSSLIEADLFFDLGGFNPHLAGPEDIDLLRRVALLGDLAETEHLIACVARGEHGSRTDYEEHPKWSRWAREMILNSPGVFERMRASANTGFWHGRMLRVYLTSLLWNLLRGRLWLAASRATYGLWSLVLSVSVLLSPRFWLAVIRPYRSETFRRGFLQASLQTEQLEPGNPG